VPSVGDNIDAYCLKCKLLLAHVILFKVDGAVSRVKCKTCGAEHKYRPAPGTVKKAEKGERTVTRKAASPKKADAPKAKLSDAQVALQWDLKIRNRQPDAPVRNYSIQETYKINDVINHSKFGVGFVEKILSDKSMSVLFADSVKLLAMNIA
jgi:hypothetical protein